VLGLRFGSEKANAHRNTTDVLAMLKALGDFPFNRPDRGQGRTPLGTPDVVKDA